eukprot:COSAG01_NODE_67138_length_268_cov_0.579882_1_plen_30_part_01
MKRRHQARTRPRFGLEPHNLHDIAVVQCVS